MFNTRHFKVCDELQIMQGLLQILARHVFYLSNVVICRKSFQYLILNRIFSA